MRLFLLLPLFIYVYQLIPFVDATRCKRVGAGAVFRNSAHASSLSIELPPKESKVKDLSASSSR
jgi:hypothetical protein